MRLALVATLIIILCLFHTFLFSQSEIEKFSPGSKSVGYGGSLVVQVRDPSAIYWNPAVLSGLKDRELLLSINRPFSFNFVSLTQFVPLYGTFGLALSRIPTSTENVDRGTVAWGYKVMKNLSIGSNVNIEKFRDDWFGSWGIALFVGNSNLGTLNYIWKEASSKTFDRLNLGVTIHNIPLNEKLFEPEALLGFSYLFSSRGLLLNTGYHILKKNNTFHFGLGLKLFRNLSIFSGVEDLDFDFWRIGLEYSHANFMVDLSYSKELEVLLFTVSARISRKPTLLAAPHYNRAIEQIKSGNYKSAVYEFKKYLAFDLTEDKTDTARYTVKTLEKKLTVTQYLVDSLFARASKILLHDKPQQLRAALILTKILKLDARDLKARRMLANLKPFIDEFISKSQIDGVQKFESKEYFEAKEIFNKILLFKKNDEIALKYLSEIDEVLGDLGEEYFFRGVGYYRQKNFTLAKIRFLLALEYNPNLEEAKSYLKRTIEKIEEYQKEILKLLTVAESFENRREYVEATKKYIQVIKLDNKNKIAKLKVKKLRPKIKGFVENKLHEALRYFREENFDKAEEAFSLVLSVDPEHNGASRYLAKLGDVRNQKAMEYVNEGENYFDKHDWQRALNFFNKALMLNPNNSKVVQKKKDSEKKLKIFYLRKDARTNFIAEEFIAAVEIYEEILQLEPHNNVAKKELAQCKVKIHEKVRDYFNDGIKLYTLEKYEDAIKKWDQALELDLTHKRSAEYKQRALERIKALKALKN